MKVFGHPLSTCTRKVLLTLEEKGRTGDLTVVDLFHGEQKSEAHMGRHPFGVVPVLDDDGFVLWESRAIIRYLDAKLHNASLTPSDPRARARMDQWLSADQSYVAPHTRTLAFERVVKPHEKLPSDAAVDRAAESALGNTLRIIDRTLRHTRHLAGDDFSLADVSLMPYIASLPMLRATHLLEGLEGLGRWWASVRMRPAWGAVLARTEPAVA